MQRFKIMGLVLAAVLAMTAIASATASASQKLDLTWGYAFGENQLKAGEEFRMNNNESTITFETSDGNVTCSSEYFPNDQGFVGKDQTNNKATDTVELNYSYGAIDASKYCASATPLGSEAVVEVYGYSPLGTLKLHVGLTDTAVFKSNSKTEPVYVYMGFTGGAQCYYTFTALKGSLTLAPWFETYNQLEVNFEKRPIKLAKELSSAACPKKASITAPFQFQTKDPEIGFYIFGSVL